MTTATAPASAAAPSGSLARWRQRWRRPRRAPLVAPPAAGAAPPAFALPLPAGIRCGLGRVLSVDALGRPRVRLDDAYASELVAEWALPFRYQPTEGDLLVVVGRGARQWVIGVAHGQGRAEMAFRGDFTLAAGRVLRLQADRGLRLMGRLLSLRTGALELVAGALLTRVEEAALLVTGLLEEVAGAGLRVTEEEETLLARDVTIMAEESVRLDGELLQLS